MKDPERIAFDPFTPPVLVESAYSRLLLGHEDTLTELRVRGCNCCPWCNRHICADEEDARHCAGSCEKWEP
jgi:hypothetical protein